MAEHWGDRFLPRFHLTKTTGTREPGKRESGSCCRGSPLLETLPAEYRAALCGLEGNRGFLAATGARCPGFDFGIVAGGCGAQTGGPFGFAGFATLGFVFELFVVEEQLFASSEDEIAAAVNTLQNFVLKFHARHP